MTEKLLSLWEWIAAGLLSFLMMAASVIYGRQVKRIDGHDSEHASHRKELKEIELSIQRLHIEKLDSKKADEMVESVKQHHHQMQADMRNDNKELRDELNMRLQHLENIIIASFKNNKE